MVKTKQLNVKLLVSLLSNSQKRNLITKIESKEKICQFIGMYYDESLAEKILLELKNSLGIW